MSREKQVAMEDGTPGTFVNNLRDLATQTARETAGQVRQAAASAYQSGREKVERGVEDAQGYIRRRPLQALSIALGAGVVLGYLLRSRRGGA